MPNRLPTMEKVSPIKYTDVNNQVQIQLQSIDDSVAVPGINGTNPKIGIDRTATCYMNVCTDQSREIQIARFTLKWKVLKGEYTQGDENVVPYEPVTDSTGNVRFTTSDVRSTLKSLVDILLDDPIMKVPDWP